MAEAAEVVAVASVAAVEVVAAAVPSAAEAGVVRAGDPCAAAEVADPIVAVDRIGVEARCRVVVEAVDRSAAATAAEQFAAVEEDPFVEIRAEVQ